jgi:hypothetical protein
MLPASSQSQAHLQHQQLEQQQMQFSKPRSSSRAGLSVSFEVDLPKVAEGAVQSAAASSLAAAEPSSMQTPANDSNPDIDDVDSLTPSIGSYQPHVSF